MAKWKSQRPYSHTLGKRDYKPKNLRPFPIKKALAFLFVILIFGGIFYFLFFSEHFRIKNIEVSGARSIHKADIVSATNFILSQKKLGILPKDNFLLIAESQLKESLLDSFPKIFTLEIKKISPDRLNMIISEREAEGIWCGANCFYFDKEGIGFEESPKSVGSLILSVIDEREETRSLGDNILSGEYVEFFRSIKELIDTNFSFAIKNFVIKNSGEIELLTSGAWRILLDKNVTAEFQLSNLKYILDEEIADRANELDYADLRLGNRVYYKYKDY